jgi:hypothetical protein
MRYDNPKLPGANRYNVYLHAWIRTSRREAVTGIEFLRTITEEILDRVVRDMTDPAAGSGFPIFAYWGMRRPGDGEMPL